MRYSSETSERSVEGHVRSSEKVHHKLVLCSNCYHENFGRLIKNSGDDARLIKSSSKSGRLSSSRAAYGRKLDAFDDYSREGSETREKYRRLTEKLDKKMSKNRGLFEQKVRGLDEDIGHGKSSKGSERGIKLLEQSRAMSESMSQSKGSRDSQYTQNESDDFSYR